jgi:hypothetical protein
VHSITYGASELQECFDSLAQQAQRAAGAAGQQQLEPALGVVSWHADWCEPCRDAAAQLGQLAAALQQQHPGSGSSSSSVAFFTLDVEASSANTAFALEKVMKKPESRRAGAKPLLRSGAKFPCITLHQLPSLQPVATLAGPDAVRELQQALREHAAAAAASQRPAPAAAPAAAGTAAAPASVAAAGQPPSRLVVLKKGAAEAKELLAAGRASGAPVVVVWTQLPAGGDSAVAAAASEALDLQAAAAEAAAATRGLVVVNADAGASSSNQLLAGALKVKAFPEVQVYRDMKLASKLACAAATPAGLLRLAAQLAAPASSGSGSPAASAPAAPTTTPTAALEAAAAAAPATATAAAGGTTATTSSSSSPFDPPAPKFAKPGATKRFPDSRLGHFFPKMPCLRCEAH